MHALRICGQAIGFGFAAVVASMPAPAQDRYRNDQPPVLAPTPAPPAPVRRLPWDDLARALREHGAARVVLFWEDSLKSQVSARYDDVETRDSRRNADGYHSDEEVLGPDGEHRYGETGSQSSERQVRHAYTNALDAAPDDSKAPLASQAMQTQFMDELRRGGVAFVDRALVTRIAAAEDQSERPNLLGYEMQGLAGYADLLLQVTSHPDPAAGLGRAFRVSMRDLHSGQTLFDFMTRADVPVAEARGYVASRDGFSKMTPRKPAPSEFLRELAAQTGDHLLEALHARR